MGLQIGLPPSFSTTWPVQSENYRGNQHCFRQLVRIHLSLTLSGRHVALSCQQGICLCSSQWYLLCSTAKKMNEGEDLHSPIKKKKSSFCFELPNSVSNLISLLILTPARWASMQEGRCVHILFLILEKIEGLVLSEPPKQDFSGERFKQRIGNSGMFLLWKFSLYKTTILISWCLFECICFGVDYP